MSPPCSSNIRRTRPEASPATIESPTRSVPRCTSTGRHRAAAAVEVSLDRDALGLHVRVRPQVQRRVRGEQDRLEQRVDVRALLGGDVDEHRLAAVLLGDQACTR
jgi:hypothetical protein